MSTMLSLTQKFEPAYALKGASATKRLPINHIPPFLHVSLTIAVNTPSAEPLLSDLCTFHIHHASAVRTMHVAGRVPAAKHALEWMFTKSTSNPLRNSSSYSDVACRQLSDGARLRPPTASWIALLECRSPSAVLPYICCKAQLGCVAVVQHASWGCCTGHKSQHPSRAATGTLILSATAC